MGIFTASTLRNSPCISIIGGILKVLPCQPLPLFIILRDVDTLDKVVLPRRAPEQEGMYNRLLINPVFKLQFWHPAEL